MECLKSACSSFWTTRKIGRQSTCACSASRRSVRARDSTVKFEGGWSTATYRRKCSRDEGAAGDQVFHYKDQGFAVLAHKLVLTQCGLSKSWVIIQEVAKVQAGNEATSLLHSVQGSSYAKHYKMCIGDARHDRGKRHDASNRVNVGGEGQAQGGTGTAVHLDEGSSKGITHQQEYVPTQVQQDAADCASQGRQRGHCGFAGRSCKIPAELRLDVLHVCGHISRVVCSGLQ